MKKLFALALVIVTMTTLLTGCIGIFECDLCKETKFGVKHEGEILGEEFTYCADCKEELDEAKDALGDIFG